MSWGSDLIKIRRMLRDPDGNIWSDAFLRHLYNDLQQDLQHGTRVLEGVQAVRVPGLFHFSYMHDWEWRHLPGKFNQFYQCLNIHDSKVFCHRWEPQEVTGIASDVSDYGIHFTHPWEAFMGETPAVPIQLKFPTNFRSMKFIAYDEQPIMHLTKKLIQSSDPSYITTEGEPRAYYNTDLAGREFVIYPRPAAAFADDPTGEGVAFFAEGDTEDVTGGTIAIRTGDISIGDGASMDIVGTIDQVFIVYDLSPVDIETISDEGDYPEFLKKYIRYGVIARAYDANTDGRIPSLSAYWERRSTIGMKFVKQYMRMRKTDRDYRLATKGVRPLRNFRHPRLPDKYPASNP